MACRVGITQSPDDREAYWRSQHPTLYGWQIISDHYSKEAAQKAEDEYAYRNGCQSKAGGGQPGRGKWYVYTFWH